jgi:methionyl-tRNA formyltransferase
MLKVKKTRKGSASSDCAPGTVLSLSDNGVPGILVSCGTGSLLLLSVVPEGKKPMDAIVYANGRGLRAGDKISS